ncbi:hypothetical protein AAE02nite_51350 [Adhaeribacter aerolatus]|uniref:Putative beta-lactamase-inhibitor-like PepSY-like domain-containing protein n=1 Tax=Adhaeribacter aerolatus TaxID=670289 RepID=A0A512B684_9BACT|nr:PepSY-like domain-containing protein [Adhaeribacter aerolatus]GEO07471.1 hypothetical protein AAE02nite_51350 [Adhaeribacter aerolatus]
MKAFLFAAILCSSGLVACSQDVNPKKVPALVKNALQLKFPDAVDIEWEKHKKLFEADYDVAATEYAALIDASGKIIMTKKEILVTELPAAISATIQKNFADYEVNDLEQIEKDGAIFYQVELEKRNKALKQVFTADGNINTALAYWD